MLGWGLAGGVSPPHLQGRDPCLRTVGIKMWEFDCSTKVGGLRDVEVGSSRTGQARRQHTAAAIGAEREAVGALWREHVRKMGRIRGRGVCFVVIS